MSTAYELMANDPALAKYKDARSQFFQCARCIQREQDVKVVNESAAAIHLVFNDEVNPGERNLEHETAESRALDARGASTLPPSEWISIVTLKLSGRSESFTKPW